MQQEDSVTWVPELDYYMNLIQRLVDSILFYIYYNFIIITENQIWSILRNTSLFPYHVKSAISGKTQFSSTDWRFNEFPNPAVYALYMTCVELMALPSAHIRVANNILNVVTTGLVFLILYFYFDN